MHYFLLLVALATASTPCEVASYIPGLVIRQSSTKPTGGFATRSALCMTGQVDCGSGVSQEICCPSGTFCFNSNDQVCCPTNEDCSAQFFAAPQCADHSWILCTNYAPNFPTYIPNDPGYWCCPNSTQCLVSTPGGYICSSVNDGDMPGITVLSGEAPTQASTATTLPTGRAGSATVVSSPGSSSTSSTPTSVRNSAAIAAASSLEIFVGQIFFTLISSVVLLKFA